MYIWKNVAVFSSKYVYMRWFGRKALLGELLRELWEAFFSVSAHRKFTFSVAFPAFGAENPFLSTP